MSMADLPVLTALKTKMRWHQTRQRVLAENVANADTPGFRARDLRAPSFETLLEPARGALLAPARTNPGHLGAATAGSADFRTDSNTDWEVTPEGNGVVLEEQMMKVAENQMDYQMVTTLYSRSLSMLRSALGRR